MCESVCEVLLQFFFFQAEDGIRDVAVTGVQTCALPIWSRDGRLPWLERHLARLEASLAALGAAEPPEDLADVVRFAVGHRPGDRVVRLQVTDGRAEISTRAVNADQGISVIVADEVHHPYPHKTTRPEPVGRALANARRAGANDALLVTADGLGAQGTAWNLFWW